MTRIPPPGLFVPTDSGFRDQLPAAKRAAGWGGKLLGGCVGVNSHPNSTQPPPPTTFCTAEDFIDPPQKNGPNPHYGPNHPLPDVQVVSQIA